MFNKFKAEFPGLACNESFARMIAAGFVMDMDPTCAELADIKTAVSEAVTNAIIHGYNESGGPVTLEGKREGKTVTFTISDFGKGIEDVELARTPMYTGAPDGERSGMGFTVMETFMDSVVVESTCDNGTKVVLTKTFSEVDTKDEQ